MADGVCVSALGVRAMQYGRQVSLNGVTAGFFGVLAVALLVAEVVLLGAGHGASWIYALGHASVLCGMTAATLFVRGFFLAARLREQKCFDTGREVGRAESSGVRDLHAIS